MTQHLKPRSTTVVIYQGDDMERLAELNRRVLIAKRNAEQRTGTERRGDDDQSVTDAEAAYDTFVDEAAARALEIELHHIGRRRFRDLILEHPPRVVPRKVDAERTVGEETPAQATGPAEVEHEDDEGWHINTETFSRALLCYRDNEIVTIARPEFATKTDIERFIDDDLADGDYDGLWQAAYFLNRSPSSDPKVLRSTLDSPSTDET